MYIYERKIVQPMAYAIYNKTYLKYCKFFHELKKLYLFLYYVGKTSYECACKTAFFIV